MALPRKYSTRTGFLNFPPGVSPADKKGIDFAQDAIQSLTGADDVKVSFDLNAQDQPLLHRMNVETFEHAKKGQFINTAGIDGDVADAIGDLIEDLSNDKDPQMSLDAIEQTVKGEGDSGEGEEKEDGKDKDDPFGKPESKPEIGPPTDKGTSPTPGADMEKKTPFASRSGQSKKKSVLKRAMMLEKEYDVPVTEGSKLVRGIDKCAGPKEGFPYLRREIQDEDGEPLSREDYVRIAEILTGEQAPRRKGSSSVPLK